MKNNSHRLGLINLQKLKESIRESRYNMMNQNKQSLDSNQTELTQTAPNNNDKKNAGKDLKAHIKKFNSLPIDLQKLQQSRGQDKDQALDERDDNKVSLDKSDRRKVQTFSIRRERFKIRSSISQLGRQKSESSVSISDKNIPTQQIQPKNKFGSQEFIYDKPIMEQRAEQKTLNLSSNQKRFKSYRSKSEHNEKRSIRLQRIAKFSQQRLQKNKLNQRNVQKYRNQKLNILVHQYFIMKNGFVGSIADAEFFKQDLENMVQEFTSLFMKKERIWRNSQGYKSTTGKLLYFIGYEVLIRHEQDIDKEYQYQEIVVSNYYQIYFAMKLKMHLLLLQSYFNLIQISIQNSNYRHAEKYAQKCLLASIYYRQKYYEQRTIEKISMCQYYKGNICQATYLHDNNGQVTVDSIRKIRDGYNEQQQLQTIFHYLYETQRFQLQELLDKSEYNIKKLVIFKSPRISIDDSMSSKQNQLKKDIRKMQRYRQFKGQVQIIKKQVKLHTNLFTVQQANMKAGEFRLKKRNMTVDEQNESSQILLAHQSLNRIIMINKRSIRSRFGKQFIQFCKKVLSRLF